GSSHALMYGKLIDGICEKSHLSVAFLTVDATPAFFKATVNNSFPTIRDAQEFDEARKHWLRIWQPKAVVVIDRWDTLVDTGGQFERDLRTFLQEVSPLTKRVLFVAQVPVTGTGGDSVNIRELMAWHMRQSHSFPLIFPDSDDPRRRRAV